MHVSDDEGPYSQEHTRTILFAKGCSTTDFSIYRAYINSTDKFTDNLQSISNFLLMRFVKVTGCYPYLVSLYVHILKI